MLPIGRRGFLKRGAGLVACLASAGLTGRARAGDFYPWGMDVSHWQGAIDWDTVASSGIAFAFVKATEGTTYRDPRFAFNYSEIARVGIFRGAYHFGRPGTDAATQARFLVNNVNPEWFDL